MHGPVGAEIAAGLREVLADGRSRFDVPVRGRLWHGRGPLQEWRLYSYPVRSPDGEIVGVGLVVVDVTAAARTRREVDALAAERERALTRYQGLVEATSAAVWIREPDGSAVHDSPALRAITGQSVEEYRGWGFLDAVDPAHRDDVRGAWRRAVADGRRGRHLHLPAVHANAGTAGSARGRCRCASRASSSSGWAPTPTSTTRSAPASGSPCSPGRRAPWARCTTRRRG